MSSPVPLKKVIADILAPYSSEDTERITLTGSDDVLISVKAVTGTALILHELATNAAKYGALNHPEGRLSVNWELSDVLRLDWLETGITGVAAPAKTGFGSKLIRGTIEGQFQGNIVHAWMPSGLSVTIKLSAAKLR